MNTGIWKKQIIGDPSQENQDKLTQVIIEKIYKK
jgi:hypothetical protein